LSYILKQKHVCIPRSFVVKNVCSQGKTLCSPCILQTDESTIICVIFGLNKNTIQYNFQKIWERPPNSRPQEGTWSKFQTEDPQIFGVTCELSVKWRFLLGACEVMHILVREGKEVQ